MFSVALCTNYCGSTTEQERERERERHTHTHTHTHTQKESVKLVCLCVTNCQESWAACDSGQNSALPGPVSFHCLRPWLPSVQAIPTRPFSSSATTSMGENSPTMYSLQCSFLKTWVNFHPGLYGNGAWNMFFFWCSKIFIFSNVVTQIFIELWILKCIYRWKWNHPWHMVKVKNLNWSHFHSF